MEREKLKLNTPLKIDEIDFRIQSINKGGYATILAYKDARADMNRLDEVFGVGGWQRAHKEVKGVVYCGIGVNMTSLSAQGLLITKESVSDIDYVWKWDAGSESMTEKQKGEASDSFKRAGFNWGIGRELYEYPVIQVKLNENEFSVESGKAKQTWNLKLKDWVWFSQFTDGKITYLAAKDQDGKKRFAWGEFKQ